jgi:hypothetical protein
MGVIYDDEAMGKYGFKRVPSGTASPTQGSYAAVQAINNDVTLGPGTTTKHGDDLQDGDVIQQGAVVPTQFSQVEVKSGGVLLCFYDEEQ